MNIHQPPPFEAFPYLTSGSAPLGNSTGNSTAYFDHNATTPLYLGVERAVSESIFSWGNPSSIHWASRGPKQILRETRRDLAKYLVCDPLEIIFNSGGSEGNATVIHSVFQQVSLKNQKKMKFITTTVEHPSVMKSLSAIAELGAQVVHVPMLPTGKLDMEFFKSQLDHHTALVSIMAANNEFGSIFPLKEICELAHNMGSLVHTDAVQAFGKLPIQLKQWGVDYATFSAHKFYALKGCGFLYVRKGVPFQSLIPGGGQERSRRAGTENILGIASLKAVIPFLPETAKRANQTRFLRDEFESQIKSRISGVQINAVESDRLPNTSSLVIDGIDGETLLMSLDMKGVAVSTGAACSSGNPEPSPSLLALGLSRAQAQRSLRISFGWGNTQHELDHLVETLIETVAYLRSLNPSIHSSYEKTTELHP